METAPPTFLSCAEQGKELDPPPNVRWNDECTRYGALQEETSRLLPQDCRGGGFSSKTGTEAAGMAICHKENHQASKNSTPTVILILIVITTFLCVQWVDQHHTVTELANKNAHIQEQIREQENSLQRAVADQNQQNVHIQEQEIRSQDSLQRAVADQNQLNAHIQERIRGQENSLKRAVADQNQQNAHVEEQIRGQEESLKRAVADQNQKNAHVQEQIRGQEESLNRAVADQNQQNAHVQEQIRGQEESLKRAVADQNQQIQRQESSQKMQRAEEAERLADLESAVAEKLRAFNASIQASKEVAHPPYIKHPLKTSSCPPGLEIKTIEECAVAGAYVRATFKNEYVSVNHWEDSACGCFVSSGVIYFNVAISCYTAAADSPVCRKY